MTLKECIDSRPANNTEHFNLSFENFAKKFVIEDEKDEDQCRRTREGLGFESDHPFDVEVCQEFESYMCDSFFDGIEEIRERLDQPTEFVTTEYDDIE